jgi:hypothetical protein
MCSGRMSHEWKMANYLSGSIGPAGETSHAPQRDLSRPHGVAWKLAAFTTPCLPLTPAHLDPWLLDPKRIESDAIYAKTFMRFNCMKFAYTAWVELCSILKVSIVLLPCPNSDHLQCSIGGGILPALATSLGYEMAFLAIIHFFWANPSNNILHELPFYQRGENWTVVSGILKTHLGWRITIGIEVL